MTLSGTDFSRETRRPTVRPDPSVKFHPERKNRLGNLSIYLTGEKLTFQARWHGGKEK